MADYKEKNAAYALNSYTWKLLRENLGWKEWKGVPPIIPVQQQPELMQSGRAFIVYGSALHPPGHLYQLNTEAVSYVIYAPSATETNRIVNLLFDTFKRQDDAAADVNDWLASEADARGSHRGVYFTSINSSIAEKAEDPSDEEGGYFAGMVLLTAQFITDEPNIVTSGFTYP